MVIEPHMKQGRQHKLISTIFLATSVTKKLDHNTNIPLRTIQQYEQRQKNINKAQAETLLRLSRVLNCSVEDLIEKVPVSDPI